ncbi:MAG TPA: ABC transporter permease [Bryobacteraceae bacterium]|nr:ABC transporter permease [Bryobacteraceae bacterium]
MTSHDLGADLFNLIIVPFFALTFLAIMLESGRRSLLGYALLAPVLITLWQMALTVAGELINRDKYLGILEAVVATPAPFALVMVGRVTVVTAFGLVGFAESWLVAFAVFHIAIPIRYPEVLVATLLAAAFAAAGTALLFSAVFALKESARVYQNSITFPFYLLGGILVPVAYLPAWVQPISRGVFLSWAADLLRDSLGSSTPIDVPYRVGMVLLLGGAGTVLGWLLIHRMVDYLRREGTLGIV